MKYLRVLIVKLVGLGVRRKQLDQYAIPLAIDDDEGQTQAPAVPTEEQSWKRELATQLAFTRSILALGTACPDNPYGRMASGPAVKAAPAAQATEKSPQQVAAVNPKAS